MALAIESDEAFDSKQFMGAVWGAIDKLYGEYGASKTGLKIIDYDAREQFAVIRVSLVAVDVVRASLASITSIGNRPVAVHTNMVSGTLKALHAKMRR